ncbi:hypothetical protein V8G54_000458 [Vigna mungo]|uniref:Uncharacterized protein n=1 Tax=Vigna mungo TaxID=3915 RepID=A0AAQ3P5A9_VIGMU
MFFRSNNFNLHYRFKHPRSSFSNSFPKCSSCCQLECQHTRIYIVIRTIYKYRSYINNWKASKHTIAHALFQSFHHPRNVFFWYSTSFDFTLELISTTWIHGFKPYCDICKLTLST